MPFTKTSISTTTQDKTCSITAVRSALADTPIASIIGIAIVSPAPTVITHWTLSDLQIQ